MERRGWLQRRRGGDSGRRARRDYVLTRQGKSVLSVVRERLRELYSEVARPARNHKT
jgi:DNA-binding PadR family transcriptional regulator